MKIWLLFLPFYYGLNSILCATYDNHGLNRSHKHGNREVLIVSTLDGVLHGIDVHDGKSLWTITNSPLVSQSLSNLEFFKDGKKYRLIPSLEGQLYMLEADNERKGLHALPINADALFTSSFQLSSDSLLVGGKEQRVIGFNPLNGEIKYRCSKDGCHQTPTFLSDKESCDLLLCRRVSHVVRAVNLESGHEKWNFSVGQDELITPNSGPYPRSPAGRSMNEGVVPQGGCVMSPGEEDDSDRDDTVQWSFDVERGSVLLSSRDPFRVVRWQRDLGASLSRVWLLRGRSVRALSIFARDANSRVEHVTADEDEFGCPTRRSLFLGSFEGHMYVQLEDGSARRSPRPIYVALVPSTDISTDGSVAQTGLTTGRHRVSKVTRFAPPIANIPHCGFFRPSMIQDESAVIKKWFTFHDNNYGYPYSSDPLVVRFGSFLFQKAVFVCLVLVVGHLLFKYVYLPYQMGKTQQSASICDSNNNSVNSMVSLTSSTAVVGHVSRYETDYEHVRCLGRGAFGVVFEARHRVDQYHYAVKRVRVRYSGQARDRLLQEVQAFAHLEHPGIVRYYQAWFELPPDGWQEQRDRDLSLTKACVSNDAELATDRSITDVSDSTANSASDDSLACADSNQCDWPSIAGVSDDRSRSCRINGDSLIIFDRSESIEPSSCRPPAATAPTIWAQCSYSSSDGSSQPPSNDPNVHSNRANVHSNQPDAPSNHSNSHSNQPSAPSNHSNPHNNRPNLPSNQPDAPSNCSHIYLFISMHLYSGTTLQHRLQQQVEPHPARETRLAIFAQIVDAVAYLHSNGLMHRDLKPSNILFDNQDHIRIVDFGLATPLVRTSKSSSASLSVSASTSGATAPPAHSDSVHTSNVGTQLYMSPEQQNGSLYDQKVDIFALGIIFIELMVPLRTAMERVMVLNDARKLRFSDDLRENYGAEVEFVSELLQHDPTRRPNCEQILSHDILSDVMMMAASSTDVAATRPRSISYHT